MVLNLSSQDLGSILTFLRICSPLDDEGYFKSLILRPISRSDETGFALIKVSLVIHTFMVSYETDILVDADDTYLLEKDQRGQFS